MFDDFATLDYFATAGNYSHARLCIARGARRGAARQRYERIGCGRSKMEEGAQHEEERGAGSSTSRITDLSCGYGIMIVIAASISAPPSAGSARTSHFPSCWSWHYRSLLQPPAHIYPRPSALRARAELVCTCAHSGYIPIILAHCERRSPKMKSQSANTRHFFHRFISEESVLLELRICIIPERPGGTACAATREQTNDQIFYWFFIHSFLGEGLGYSEKNRVSDFARTGSTTCPLSGEHRVDSGLLRISGANRSSLTAKSGHSSSLGGRPPGSRPPRVAVDAREGRYRLTCVGARSSGWGEPVPCLRRFPQLARSPPDKSSSAAIDIPGRPRAGVTSNLMCDVRQLKCRICHGHAGLEAEQNRVTAVSDQRCFLLLSSQMM
ncbi:hypothetical protein J6590_021627 [Homalodisca vitripennis]|nr:hypothetical protein J6590_021627 [Homalodisca vitripennis]